MQLGGLELMEEPLIDPGTEGSEEWSLFTPLSSRWASPCIGLMGLGGVVSLVKTREESGSLPAHLSLGLRKGATVKTSEVGGGHIAL